MPKTRKILERRNGAEIGLFTCKRLNLKLAAFIGTFGTIQNEGLLNLVLDNLEPVIDRDTSNRRIKQLRKFKNKLKQ